MFTDMLEYIREKGWTVAIHRDYKIGMAQSFMTSWTFTHEASGKFLIGSGSSNQEAVEQVAEQVWALESQATQISTEEDKLRTRALKAEDELSRLKFPDTTGQ